MKITLRKNRKICCIDIGTKIKDVLRYLRPLFLLQPMPNEKVNAAVFSKITLPDSFR